MILCRRHEHLCCYPLGHSHTLACVASVKVLLLPQSAPS